MQSAFGVEHGEISKSVARGVRQIQNMSTRTVFPTGNAKTPNRVLQAQRKVGDDSKRAANKLRGQQHKKYIEENWEKGNLNYETSKNPLENMPKYGTK
jgi:hypothetical protein